METRINQQLLLSKVPDYLFSQMWRYRLKYKSKSNNNKSRYYLTAKSKRTSLLTKLNKLNFQWLSHALTRIFKEWWNLKRKSLNSIRCLTIGRPKLKLSRKDKQRPICLLRIRIGPTVYSSACIASSINTLNRPSQSLDWIPKMWKL